MQTRREFHRAEMQELTRKMESLKKEAFSGENEALWSVLAEGQAGLANVMRKVEGAEYYATSPFERFRHESDGRVSLRDLERLESDLLQAVKELRDARSEMARIDRALAVMDVLADEA